MPDDQRPDDPTDEVTEPSSEQPDEAPGESSEEDSGGPEETPADDEPTGALPPWFPADATEQPDEPKPGSRRNRRILLGVLTVLAGLYVIGLVMTGLRMPANATVGGIDVGGMSPGDAREKVRETTEPRLGEEVELLHEGKRFTVDPAAAALELDVERSVEKAGGEHSLDPRDMLALVFGSHEHDLAVEADDEKLGGIITAIATSIDREVVEALITFPKSKPTPREPEAGLAVRKADAARAVVSGYLVATKPIPVPTEVVEPTVDQDGLDRAMDEIAEPAVSGPVTIQVGKKEVDLPVGAYTPALEIRVIDGSMTPHLDPEKLAKPLTGSTTGIGKKAVDATVRIRNGKPVVVPGKEGIGLQPEEMAEKLVPAVTETGDARSVEIEAKVVEPEFTTEDAKKLKITERVSSFTTYYPHAAYRNTNQGRAAELIDGTILEPGETFSFNDTVGERTVANGFTTGTVINGGVFREELGGGVSQVATTTYNAAFFAGLDDIEHRPHAFYLDRYPMGREATVYFGNLDLRFRNSTKYGVLIRAWVNRSTPGRRGEMHVEMWSTKVWDIKAGLSKQRNFRKPGKQYDDTDRCVPQAPIQGFDVDVHRTFMQNGKVVKRETDRVTYQAADRVICGKKP